MCRGDALQRTYRGGDDIPVAQPLPSGHLLGQMLYDEATYPPGIELLEVAMSVPRVGGDSDEEGIWGAKERTAIGQDVSYRGTPLLDGERGLQELSELLGSEGWGD